MLWGWLRWKRGIAVVIFPAPSTQAKGHSHGGGVVANTSQLPLSQAFPLPTSLILSSLLLAFILPTP